MSQVNGIYGAVVPEPTGDAQATGQSEQSASSASSAPGGQSAAGTPTFAAGTPEAEIVRAVLMLEQQQERAAELRRDMRTAQREAQHAKIRKEKKASRWRAAMGVIQAGAQMAGGVAKGLGIQGSGDTLKVNEAEAGMNAALLEGSGKITAAVGNWRAEHFDREADKKEQRAGHLGDAADQADEAEQRAQRFQDKAMGHLERVNDARRQAHLTAARG